MRETRLTGPQGEARLVTGDAGTTLLDAQGFVVKEHGADLHDAELERLAGEGWTAAPQADPASVPKIDAGEAAGVAEGPGDPAATVEPTTG